MRKLMWFTIGFAAACAAEAVQVVGARTSMPTAEKMATVWPALNGNA